MTRNRPIPHISEADKDFVRSLIIHEDAAMLAFNKPSGLPSQVRGNRARNLDHLLWAFAKSNGKRPRLVHRLDAGTSGVILAGRTHPASAALSRAFEGRDMRKTYLALVAGKVPSEPSGTIDAPIARIEMDGRMQVVAGHPDGKPAVTHWQVLARSNDTALLKLQPETGRIHQIRVHLAHIDCPILGDRIYGGAPASRLMLHAGALAGPHPGGDTFDIFAPVPDDFIQAGIEAGLDMALALAPDAP